jgi:putative Ca2+/H+ antiporter (TMEM165/GDT1 family)
VHNLQLLWKVRVQFMAKFNLVLVLVALFAFALTFCLASETSADNTPIDVDSAVTIAPEDVALPKAGTNDETNTESANLTKQDEDRLSDTNDENKNDGGDEEDTALVGQSEAFLQSLLMIFATEIGDKTFFIAAIMAMRHSRGVVLLGALGALWVMTIMSVGIGFALPHLIPASFTHVAASLLFAYFGVRLLYDAANNTDSGPSDELEAVEKELDEVDKELVKSDDLEMGGSRAPQPMKVAGEAFALTFLAEWGDRSQIATIALGASSRPLGVIIGGCIGHAICTGLAVQGGRMLASSISERTVGYVGGSLFLVFAVHEFFLG